MANQERPEQELTPGYYDHQFGDRVHRITKAGFAPPGPSGGGSFTGGGCLKGGGGIVIGLILVLRLLMSEGCRSSSPSNYYTPNYNPPTYRVPPPKFPQPNRFNDGNFHGGGRNPEDDRFLPNRDDDVPPDARDKPQDPGFVPPER